MSISEAAAGQLRAELEALSWPDRFERLAAEEAADPSRRDEVAALRIEYADRALSELSEGWGDAPLKEAILRLSSKRMRGALGQAAKRLRNRSIVRFAASGVPSSGRFGKGLDERVIEIPLALACARLREAGEVLDAGSALNLPVVREIVGRPSARLTHFTLVGSVEPTISGDEDRFIRAFGDLRAMPFADGVFDRIVCVSTLEHVGMDNSRFGATSEQAPDSSTIAVAELIRVLAVGGELLITVPFGRQASHGWFRVFDGRGLDRLLAPASSQRVERRFFYYDRGWCEGDSTPPSSVLHAGFSSDVVTGIAVARITKTGVVG